MKEFTVSIEICWVQPAATPCRLSAKAAPVNCRGLAIFVETGACLCIFNLLPQPPVLWDYRQMPPGPASTWVWVTVTEWMLPSYFFFFQSKLISLYKSLTLLLHGFLLKGQTVCSNTMLPGSLLVLVRYQKVLGKLIQQSLYFVMSFGVEIPSSFKLGLIFWPCTGIF